MTAQQADLCQRIHSLLQRRGPLYLATVANALNESPADTLDAISVMIERGAVVGEPFRDGEKLHRYRAKERR